MKKKLTFNDLKKIKGGRANGTCEGGDTRESNSTGEKTSEQYKEYSAGVRTAVSVTTSK